MIENNYIYNLVLIKNFMDEKIVIYNGASLFNTREILFNDKLVSNLEKKYKIISPQRDGFEFVDLMNSISSKVVDKEVDLTTKNIIYFLDMGYFIPKSDVILANFDEPIDEGLVVEATYAKLMGKFVLGFRTESRTPYGSFQDTYKGTHIFPVYQTNEFIFDYSDFRDPDLFALTRKIKESIEKNKIIHKKSLPNYVLSNPNFKKLIDGANYLFEGIEEFNSSGSVDKIISRYVNKKEDLENICSKLF
jgi:nucleoside 2-deoxyribosyltransferase